MAITVVTYAIAMTDTPNLLFFFSEIKPDPFCTKLSFFNKYLYTHNRAVPELISPYNRWRCLHVNKNNNS